MSYPYDHGHTRHTSHHHNHHREEEQHYPPPPPHYPHNEPPPPPYIGGPPPPPFAADYYPPPQPPQNFNYSYPQPYPPPPVVEHVYHERDRYHPHVPPIVHHTGHEKSETPIHQHTVRVYTKANPDFSLTIRHGKVVLAPSDPADPHQHWIKDQKFSTRVKDEEGFPSFALINKATGQAMKHSVGATHPVQLTEYNPDKLDESVLWTQSKDLGDGYRAVRMINNIRLNVDAYHGDKSHGVRDGTIIVLWEWNKGDNQRWTMIPYC